ncbi:hypothetical protein AKJ62_03710 [candidate division MSBL1 archaeon SCGC-AAA259D14]|uniref:Uncharacterized protein n=1 Tax=candidate division MSBL1 archaeon SCGC-AAA259D14 TaxID=1698261 RepID=A0A133U4L2_9EURY|nr:hypothetical protein AKJ62_03710 [candidate division MSBL1 archaeon SCGC-AAA259D14]
MRPIKWGLLITLIAGAQVIFFYLVQADGHGFWYMITKQWFVIKKQWGISWVCVYYSLMVLLTFFSLSVTAVLELLVREK